MSQPVALEAGQTLARGRYQILRVLGQGGFAITYQARDYVLHRVVAIKELFPDGCVRDAQQCLYPQRFTDDQFQQILNRFVDEARLLAQLDHPNIVYVYDVFLENRTAYIVMEYLHGQTLLQRLIDAGGMLTVSEALEHIRQIGEALSVLHQRGYLHRDMKPQNAIFCMGRGAVVIDFGAARQFVASQTQKHTVIFTPAYAAPEQYSSSARVDSRTDVYGLAATMYHLITGVPPLPASERLAGIPLPAPHQVEPTIDPKISHAVMRGLELVIDARPRTVQEFLRDLTQATPSASASQTPLQTTPVHGRLSLAQAIQLAPDKGTITLDSGIYHLNNKIVINKSLSLVARAYPVRIITGSYSIYFRGNGQLYLEGLEFQSTDTTLFIEDGSVVIKECRFHSDTQQGAATICRGTSKVHVSNCLVSGYQDGVIADEHSHLITKNSLYKGNVQSGITLLGSAHGEVEGCICQDNSYYGISAYERSYLVARNNTCDHNNDGIGLLGSSNGYLEGNICRHNVDNGIYVQEQAQLTARGNTCEENENNGILIFGGAQAELFGNIFRKNRGRGINAQGRPRLIAQNNTIEENGREGIALFGSTEGYLSENMCCRNSGDGIYVERTVRATVEINTTRGNGRHNIHDERNLWHRLRNWF